MNGSAAGLPSPMNPSASAWEMAVCQLLADVQAMTDKHRTDLHGCLSDWALQCSPARSDEDVLKLKPLWCDAHKNTFDSTESHAEAPTQHFSQSDCLNDTSAAVQPELSLSVSRATTNPDQWNSSGAHTPHLPGAVPKVVATVKPLTSRGGLTLCAGPPECGFTPSSASAATATGGSPRLRQGLGGIACFDASPARQVTTKKRPNLYRSASEKFKRDRKRARDYLTNQTREKAKEYESRLERCISSATYEWASTITIILNAIIIGVHIQLAAVREIDNAADGHSPIAKTPLMFIYSNIAFTFVFTADLLLRWYVDGLYDFFRMKEWAWNVFDLVIVFMTCCELVFSLAYVSWNGVSEISVLRILRVVRFVRALKILRVASIFRELRLMVYSLLASFKSFFWIMMIFGTIFYLFGIALTSGTYMFCNSKRGWSAEEYTDLVLFFGTLDRAILSLFQGMSGGKDWGDFYDALQPLPSWHRYLYIFYTGFVFLVALNVISAIFVDTAIRSSELDRDLAVEEELGNRKQYETSMRQLFDEMNVNNSDGLTLREFEEHLSDERANAYFSSMKIEVDHATQLFQLLDIDSSGTISFDEFLEGCEKLKGDAKGVDLALMRYELRFLGLSMLRAVESLAPGSGSIQLLGSTSDTQTLASLMEHAKQADEPATPSCMDMFANFDHLPEPVLLT